MRYCFIMASLTGREHLLNEFINAAKKSKYKDADYYLYFQDLPGEKSEGDFDRSFFREIYVSHQRDGACLPRMYWLHKLDDYDFYIIVDDDMEFLGKEDFDTPMKFAEKVSDCGCLCTVCFRTMALYEKAVPEYKFIVKNMQYINGGLILKREIRDLLVREIDLKPYASDFFNIITYVHGYTNYQYLGSITYHKVGRKKGFEYVRRNSNEFLPLEKIEKYILDLYYDNGKYSCPFHEKDLTSEARMLHDVNDRRRLYNGKAEN